MARILTEHVETALDFLRALSPLDGLFPADYLKEYIFRGINSTEYRLVPSAFRPGARLRLHKETVSAPCTKIKTQIRAEATTLIEFFHTADRQGARLPEDTQELRDLLRRYASVDNSLYETLAWPPPQLLSLMALAQHYGVPTRLLDWSWSPYVAAYFAALGANDRAVHDGTGRICVWAISTSPFEIADLMKDRTSQDLQLVTAPASDNENLRAQRWVGLVYRQTNTPQTDVFTVQSYDELADASVGIETLIWSLTLPASEAPELTRLLAVLDVDAATIFPGLKGTADAVREMSFWPPQAEWRGMEIIKSYMERSTDLFRRHGLS